MRERGCGAARARAVHGHVQRLRDSNRGRQHNGTTGNGSLWRASNMIDLTPLEVRKKKGDFRRAMRGYDPALVDDFIDLVADRLEQLVRDHFALTERVGRQEQQIAEDR